MSFHGKPIHYKKRIASNGYIMIYVPNHPNSGINGFIAEHRLIMERYLGRYLESNEYVHHINGNRQDNSIENLQVMSNINHGEIHHKKWEKSRKFNNVYPKI